MVVTLVAIVIVGWVVERCGRLMKIADDVRSLCMYV